MKGANRFLKLISSLNYLNFLIQYNENEGRDLYARLEKHIVVWSYKHILDTDDFVLVERVSNEKFILKLIGEYAILIPEVNLEVFNVDGQSRSVSIEINHTSSVALYFMFPLLCLCLGVFLNSLFLFVFFIIFLFSICVGLHSELTRSKRKILQLFWIAGINYTLLDSVPDDRTKKN